jgi:hypothetical protein
MRGEGPYTLTELFEERLEVLGGGYHRSCHQLALCGTLHFLCRISCLLTESTGKLTRSGLNPFFPFFQNALLGQS